MFAGRYTCIGVSREKKLGGTADYAHEEGESTNDLQPVAGMRAWFRVHIESHRPRDRTSARPLVGPRLGFGFIKR